MTRCVVENYPPQVHIGWTKVSLSTDVRSTFIGGSDEGNEGTRERRNAGGGHGPSTDSIRRSGGGFGDCAHLVSNRTNALANVGLRRSFAELKSMRRDPWMCEGRFGFFQHLLLGKPLSTEEVVVFKALAMSQWWECLAKVFWNFRLRDLCNSWICSGFITLRGVARRRHLAFGRGCSIWGFSQYGTGWSWSTSTVLVIRSELESIRKGVRV